MTVLNHEWWNPETFASLGRDQRRPGRRTVRRAGCARRVEVVLNRAVVDHDVSLVVGPVFPHEVVGFSGGNKYFFPGVAGQEVIDFSHWLGALITSADIIGTRGITPVRALINEAASMIPAGGWRCAWSRSPAAARCTRRRSATPRRPGRPRPRSRAETHVQLPGRPGPPGAVGDPDQVRGHVDRRQGFLQGGAGRRRRRPGHPLRPAHHRDLGDAPGDPGDRLPLPGLLPGAVGPVLAATTGAILAHSTHLRGAGTWDAEHGERAGSPSPWPPASPRTSSGRRTWTTWTRPASTSTAFAADPDTLVVPQAGEVLYRLR